MDAAPLEALIIEAPIPDRGRIEMAIHALHASGYACWTPIDSERDQHEAYFENTDDADRAYNAMHMQKLASATPEKWTLSRNTLQETDWANAWKKYFQTEKVSKRFVIQPEWETYAPQQDEVVICIDPGMSFGTGQHETTRSCLQLLDDWSLDGNRGSFLDLGCGSGILSIAAAKLGLSPITAIDIDPDAVQGTIENIERNAPCPEIQAFAADLSTTRMKEQYDMVVANILAPVLLENASTIISTVKTNGDLILSGILTPQYPSIHRTFTNLGFSEQKVAVDGEWSTGLFHKE